MYSTNRTYHSESFTFFFIPKEWQNFISFEGWQFLAILLTSQVIGALSPLKKTDYVSHVAGYVVGIIFGISWRNSHRDRKKPSNKGGAWHEWIFGKQQRPPEKDFGKS